MRAILAGGGTATQSRLVDEFFATLLPTRHFIFLPQAISPEVWPFERAREWIHKPASFQGVEISILSDLVGVKARDLRMFDAVYIMGGNTYTLMAKVRGSGFSSVLRDFIESDGLVYGTSAGAIILGASITPAAIGPESDENTVGLDDMSGFDRLGGYLVAAHYTEEEDADLSELYKAECAPVVSIPETAGVFVDGEECKVLGEDAVGVFDQRGKTIHKPGNTFRLNPLT